ncbi:MAG: Glycosyltransferase [Rhodobacteraceae bacterium HLUCCA12]|nr:MAG: Glycosyltransferase [Rhodobacteraceae bacterium HLUCCA12]
MPAFLILSSAPVIEAPRREAILDVAFVEGMKLVCVFWPGRVRCALRRSGAAIPGGMRFSPRRLGFELIVQDPHEPVSAVLVEEANLVLCAGDDRHNLYLPTLAKGRLTRVVYTLESSLFQGISRIWASHRPLGQRLGSALRMVRDEAALRSALRQADGVQLNGYAAWRSYRKLNPNSLMYLENRVRTPMLSRAGDQRARADRLRSGAPMTLVHLGGLDADTGALDLLQAAYLLKARGVAFRLAFLGTGALESRLADGIAALGLRAEVSLDGAMDFDSQIVPLLRARADLLLCARRRGDPLSLYLEAMSLGVPVLGYANPMWRRLQADSDGGWTCRTGRVSALAAMLARLDGEREAVVRASARALDFARAHAFEPLFARRMAHLRETAGVE